MTVPSIELPEEFLRSFQPTYTHASTATWWRFANTTDPANNHFDNPGVILPWWSTQLGLLAQGAKTAELQFMEGAPPDPPAPIVVTLPALVHAVQDALSRVALAFEPPTEVQRLAQSLRDTVEELDRQLIYRERARQSRDY